MITKETASKAVLVLFVELMEHTEPSLWSCRFYCCSTREKIIYFELARLTLAAINTIQLVDDAHGSTIATHPPILRSSFAYAGTEDKAKAWEEIEPSDHLRITDAESYTLQGLLYALRERSVTLISIYNHDTAVCEPFQNNLIHLTGLVDPSNTRSLARKFQDLSADKLNTAFLLFTRMEDVTPDKASFTKIQTYEKQWNDFRKEAAGMDAVEPIGKEDGPFDSPAYATATDPTRMPSSAAAAKGDTPLLSAGAGREPDEALADHRDIKPSKPAFSQLLPGQSFRVAARTAELIRDTHEFDNALARAKGFGYSLLCYIEMKGLGI